MWSWRRDPGVYPACLCGLGNGDNKGRSPGRARISRQTIARGKPGCPGCTCSSTRVLSSTTFAHGTAGAVGARLSLRPLRFGGTMNGQTSGNWCRENESACPTVHPPERVERSRLLPLLWHCGHWPFSSRTARRGSFGNEPSTVLAEDSALEGFGNADSQRKLRDFGWGGRRRPRARDLGCVPAHPPYWRASASYRPLRAVWAICAWALRGSREIEKTLQRPLSGARPKRNLQA